MTTVLKLGGSVITEKDRAETLDGPAVDRLADAVAAAGVDELVLVHGGGSFGHHHAEAHGVTTAEGSRDVEAVTDVHGAMKALNQLVLSRLHERGVPAVPVHPFSAAHRDAGGTLSLPTGQVATLLGEGFVPVLHGDVVADEGTGVTIVSGDELVVELADALEADRVGLCSTVPGVLDESGAVVPTVDAFADVGDALGESDATDVTGGMAGKVRALLELGAPASIFGPHDVAGFLAGEDPGTRVGAGFEGDDERSRGNGTATIHITDVGPDSPPDLPVKPVVSVANEKETETSPASISVSWENVGDEPVRLGEADTVVFSAARSDDDSARLLAFDRIGDSQDAVSFDECWRVTGQIELTAAFHWVDLEPGEIHEAKPELYADGTDCLSDGSYRFEVDVTVGDPDEPEGDKTTEEWGFVLEIETK
jgi:isopentenyl phosphate kinase